MKCNSIFSVLLATAFIFASCSKETDSNDKNPVQEGESNIVELEFIADAPGNDMQQAVSAESSLTKTVRQDDGSVYWSPSEDIKVFYGELSSAKFTSLNETVSSTATFKGSIDIPVGQSRQYWAVYPYDASSTCDNTCITLTVPAIQTAVEGTFSDNVFPSVSRTDTDAFKFYNVCGGVKFTVSQTDIRKVVFRGNGGEKIAGTAKINMDADGKPLKFSAFDFVKSATEITVEAPGGGTFVPGKNYYIVMYPRTLNSGFSLDYCKVTGTATFSTTKKIVVNRGKFGLVTNKDNGLEFVAPTDLSENEKANCYIVSAPGTYRFKGNVKGNSTTLLDGTVSKVEVLWESFGTNETPSRGDIIRAVAYSDGYVCFTTPSVLRDGNAVIGVRDASNNVLWSWHIWVSGGFDPVAKAHTYLNSAGTAMDRNLGALSAEPGSVGALGLLYQWGRKDPFLGSSSISEAIPAKSTINWPSAVTSNSTNGTIANAVKHPTTFIKGNSSNLDWYYTGASTTDNTRWTSAKSIYDPCPAGWRVPGGGSAGLWSKAWGGFKYALLDGPWVDAKKGMNFGSGKAACLSESSNTVWYPATGYRWGDDACLYFTGNLAYCWSYTSNGKSVYYFYNNSDLYVHPTLTGYFRANAFSVRCMKK